MLQICGACFLLGWFYFMQLFSSNPLHFRDKQCVCLFSNSHQPMSIQAVCLSLSHLFLSPLCFSSLVLSFQYWGFFCAGPLTILGPLCLLFVFGASFQTFWIWILVYSTSPLVSLSLCVNDVVVALPLFVYGVLEFCLSRVSVVCPIIKSSWSRESHVSQVKLLDVDPHFSFCIVCLQFACKYCQSDFPYF